MSTICRPCSTSPRRISPPSWASQKTFEALAGAEKLEEHAWLIDVGPMLSDPTTRFDGLPKHCKTKPAISLDVVHEDKPALSRRKVEAAAAVQ